MGYIKHHSIVVTTSIDKLMKSAHKKAKSIFGTTVSKVVKSKINGYSSFFIATDGSKEGWDDSDTGDENRKYFIDWCNEQAYEDGSNSLSYCEFFYGEDNGYSEIVSHN